MTKAGQSGFTPTPNFTQSFVSSFQNRPNYKLTRLAQICRRRERSSQYENWCRGFTLIEITIVLALVGVIAAFGVAMSYSSLSQTTVTQERDLFVTLLLRATRAAAIANMEEAPHGVYIDDVNNRYILFTGTDPNAVNANPRYIPYTNDVITVGSTGGDTIVFEQLSGKVIDGVIGGVGTISISNGNATQGIIIRESGQIDW